MDPDQAFEELELEPGATSEEIQKAHRERARACHPDADGDLESMQRLNEARDVALRTTNELDSTSAQAVVLRRILDLESRRDEREIAQQKGRELVAAAAKIRIGRLRSLQRRASGMTLLTGAAAAILALLRAAGTGGSPGLNLFLLVLGVFAIGFGAYRTVLAESINQIQFAIDDLGSSLANRSIFADAFRAIGHGLLDADSFEEQDLERAVRIWMSLSTESLRLAWPWLPSDQPPLESLAELEPFDENGLLKEGRPFSPNYLRLSEVIDWTRAGGIGDADDRLTSLALAGAFPCYKSERGLCVDVEEIVRRVTSLDERGQLVTQERFMDAIRTICLDWLRVLRSVPPRDRLPTFRRRALRSMERMGSISRAGMSVESKLKRLARRIGQVDFVKLLIGKGLENRLLSERESLDGRGALLTMYRFGLQAKEDE